MPTDIECKPVGLDMDAGVERFAKAFAEFQNRTTEVANLAGAFLKTYDELLVEHLELADDAVELHDAIEARKAAQEELLRAIAGAPARDTSDDAADPLLPRPLDLSKAIRRHQKDGVADEERSGA